MDWKLAARITIAVLTVIIASESKSDS